MPEDSGLTSAREPGPWLSRFPDRFQRKISQGAYRPEIDGLRFFAIAFVIFGHSLERAARFFPSYQTTLAGSEFEKVAQVAPLGVNLFFAISGFILASQAIKAKANPLSGSFLKSYFGRRILRIEPPYFLMLIATWIFVSMTGYVPDGTHRFYVEPNSLNLSLIGSLFYAHDLIWGNFPRLFPPGWSLEVEVQFYLMAPLLFWLWARRDANSQRLGLAVAALAVGLLFSVLNLEKVGPLFVGYSLLQYFNFFWMGIILAYAKDGAEAHMARLPGPVATAIGWIGLALCILLAAPRNPATPGELVRLVALYASLAAVFASTFAPRSGFRAFCSKPWISLIGGACYSIYLIHIQIIQVIASLVFKRAPNLPLAGVALMFAAAAALVVAIGLVYYVQIERRFMTRNWPLVAIDALRAGAMRLSSRFARAGEPEALTLAGPEAVEPRTRPKRRLAAPVRRMRAR